MNEFNYLYLNVLIQTVVVLLNKSRTKFIKLPSLSRMFKKFLFDINLIDLLISVLVGIRYERNILYVSVDLSPVY